MDTPPLVHTGWLFLMAGHRWSTIVLMGTLVTFKMSPMKELPAMLLLLLFMLPLLIMPLLFMLHLLSMLLLHTTPLLFMLHPLFMLLLLFTVLPLLFMLPLLFTVLPLLFTMPLLSTMPLLPMLLLTQSTQHVFLLPQLPIPSEVKWPQQLYVFIYDKYLFIGINNIS